ncbi:formimidoylglutamase [Legionella hackeliae]|uniref:Formimidoylglutamase n=1 Tax=Legionella hackeliae TaxID=449 RepID=A0A0A8UX73_LEGHA|nr:formimidoylglutamase [Legionella hackeliae]KTD15268.1 formiminoglutamase [Legionella hackeliae]CEK11364.1 Formimidoylglutamase [Legionella hackeliae]STX48137.1 formimidoylglutamase [Legionella hackeliae]
MISDLLDYDAPDASLWQGRKDSLPGERFFQRINFIDLRSQTLSPAQQDIAILGFCSDAGIRRNEGRIGAKEGPLKLREQFAKLPCHTLKHLFDVGNIICNGDQLEVAQQQLAKLVDYLQKKNFKTMVFGGGHEIAWGHFYGLTSKYPKLGIINFDAHFDLRPLIKENYGTSGTPFRQISQYCIQNQLPFSYCCLGIQALGNTKSLFIAADELNVSYLTAEQMHTESIAWQLAFLDSFLLSHDAIYLTICLDVFAECFAPGVSAPQPMGLTPWQALPLLKYILQTGKVVSFDIAELSPPLDNEQKTTRLAASLVAELLDYY